VSPGLYHEPKVGLTTNSPFAGGKEANSRQKYRSQKKWVICRELGKIGYFAVSRPLAHGNSPFVVSTSLADGKTLFSSQHTFKTFNAFFYLSYPKLFPLFIYNMRYFMLKLITFALVWYI
jgi:hypothetical protein